MILKKFLKNIRNSNFTVLLIFSKNYKLCIQEIIPKEFKTIDKDLLKMEIIETKLNDNILEIYLNKGRLSI